MEKLPKYFMIKRNESNPLWQKYIDWMNDTYNQKWIGNIYKYYGYDGSKTTNGTSCYNDTDWFKEDTVVITLKDWYDYINKYKLPEKWFIRGSNELKHLAEKFWGNENNNRFKYKTYLFLNPSGDFKNWDWYKERNKNLRNKGYTEITLDQLKKYVINTNIKYKDHKYKKGDYVVITEMVSQDSKRFFTIGKVYKLNEDFDHYNTSFCVKRDDLGNVNNRYLDLDINCVTDPDRIIKVRKATKEEIANYDT